MKKSQILAALALAFALGVVAPVAGVYNNNASAVTVETPVETATTAELKAAVAKAEANTNLQAYNTLKGATVLDDIDTTTLLKDVNDAIEDLNAEYTGDKQKDNLADALEVAQATTTAANYTNYAALYNAINNTASKDFANINKLATAGLIVTLGEDEKEDVDALITEIEKNATYTNYASLVKAVSDATVAQEAQSKNVASLTEALKVYGYQSNSAIDAAAATATPIASLKALATFAIQNKTLTIDGKTSNAGTLYDAVNNAITSAKAVITTPVSDADNAAKLNALNSAYVAATGLNLSEITTPTDPTDPEEPSQPINPADPEKPGTNDGKGDGNTTTDKTPNTGVVAEGADASAKSSVSIMAGVSSFITAAGSALVAIRRGKRA